MTELEQCARLVLDHIEVLALGDIVAIGQRKIQLLPDSHFSDGLGGERRSLIREDHQRVSQ